MQFQFTNIFDCANNEERYLEDFEGKKFKDILRHSCGRICVGLTCSYFILYGRETRDFRLVNLITRHELHFPYFHYDYCESRVVGILVFSPLLSIRVKTFSKDRYKVHEQDLGEMKWVPFEVTRDEYAFVISSLNHGAAVKQTHGLASQNTREKMILIKEEKTGSLLQSCGTSLMNV
uniref:Uncharacterized protein n=1 Tax=Lactuca sativa TaxID=4236 RepID=A0A9R1VK34_LACSA|nr:hypothetical protein LSAT_V11C500256850 [Lactuca sativa]